MEKRKSNKLKTKTLKSASVKATKTTKIIKSATKQLKTPTQSTEKPTNLTKQGSPAAIRAFGIIAGVLNIILCISIAAAAKYIWYQALTIWQLLIGILIFAVLIWVNMTHNTKMHRQKAEPSDLGMNIFGSAKLLSYWVIMFLLVYYGFSTLSLLKPLGWLAHSPILSNVQNIFYLLLIILSVLMQFTTMRNMNKTWGLGYYLWIFVWAFLMSCAYAVVEIINYAHLSSDIKLSYIVYAVLAATIACLVNVVIGETYKKVFAIKQKK